MPQYNVYYKLIEWGHTTIEADNEEQIHDVIGELPDLDFDDGSNLSITDCELVTDVAWPSEYIAGEYLPL